MKQIGVDISKLVEGQPLPDDFVPACPGALVRILRKDYEDMSQGGERFITNKIDLPADGYGSARLYCRDVVAPIPNTASGHRLFYGLCHSCSTAEKTNRTTLRKRFAPKDGK